LGGQKERTTLKATWRGGINKLKKRTQKVITVRMNHTQKQTSEKSRLIVAHPGNTIPGRRGEVKLNADGKDGGGEGS